jgi:hypothetical protein
MTSVTQEGLCVSNPPKKHHYVPQFYLAGFTKTGRKDDELFVLDQQRRKQWPATPATAAFEKHFHTIDSTSPGADGDPMAIERKLATLEGQWANALREINEKRQLNADETFGTLMQFTAFMAVRVPSIRGIISDFIDRSSKLEIKAMLATSHGQAQFRRSFEQMGRPLSDEEFAQLVAFGQSGQFTVSFDQTWHVLEMIRLSLPVMFALGQRKWSIWEVRDDAPDLFCSDRPVSLTPFNETKAWQPLGFGTPNTVLTVPLNRRLALVSLLEVELPKVQMDRPGVARINSLTGGRANQLYSADADFVWLMKNGGIGNVTDLLDALSKNSTKQPIEV